MRHVATLSALLALAACCPGRPSIAPEPEPLAVTATPVATPAPTPTSTPTPTTDPVVDKAKALVAHATRIEPQVTPLLISLAKAHGGEMVKLEFRLKTLDSTARKIRKLMSRGRAAADVRIDDALRYTMRVDDDPPGAYVAAAKATLADLEAKGHEVQYVKNYWPEDDNYSGINSVLKDTTGLFWELQFHTTASLAAQHDTRPLYEEMRLVKTPLERKRALFDAATKRWNEVAVPEGVLEKGAIHPNDQVRERPRP